MTRRGIVLCAAAHCRSRGRHHPTCNDNDCTGCLPRAAADGIYLCQVCHQRLGEDALLLVARYAALEMVLTGGRAFGELVTASRDPNLSINEKAAQLRGDIQQALDELCAVISRRRGITPPRTPGFYEHPEELPTGFIGPAKWLAYRIDEILENASYVGKHRDWLAAQADAGNTAKRLHDLAHGETYRVAYPSGGSAWPVQTPNGGYALCPEDDCDGVLWSVMRHADSSYPAELVCNVDPGHRIAFYDWFRQAKKLRARAGVTEDPEPEPRRGHYVELHGGPMNGARHKIKRLPAPAVLHLTVIELTTTGEEHRRGVAYARRTNTNYDYIGGTTQ